MFNFFSELKKNIKKLNLAGGYNLISLSGEILYVEGHCGLTLISANQVCFKVKNGRVLVEGCELVLSEITDSTLKISGKIKKIEAL